MLLYYEATFEKKVSRNNTNENELQTKSLALHKNGTIVCPIKFEYSIFY
jgi:hypothetical protein